SRANRAIREDATPELLGELRVRRLPGVDEQRVSPNALARGEDDRFESPGLAGDRRDRRFVRGDTMTCEPFARAAIEPHETTREERDVGAPSQHAQRELH